MKYLAVTIVFNLALAASSFAMANDSNRKPSCNRSTETIASHKMEVTEDTSISEINECQVTPLFWDLHPPFEINNSNNLRRKPGSTFFAKGQFMILEGTVRDENCVPISDAVVEIWQADALGGTGYNGKGKDKHFIGAGRTITSNNGEYAFYTVMPGSTHHYDSPVIHIRVRHKDFLLSETLMYLSAKPEGDIKHEGNVKKDYNQRKLLLAYEQNGRKNRLGNGLRYRFDFTLEGTNLYKKY